MFRKGDPNNTKKLLCLHGGPGMDCSYILPNLGSLSDCVEVLTYTQTSKFGNGMDGLLNELEHVLGTLSPTADIYILGHSFGAVLANEYLKHKSRCIKGLILSSWIYDLSWLQSIETDESVLDTDDDYKKWFIKHVHLYFSPDKLAEGLKILSNTKYDVSIYNDIWSSSLNTFDHKSFLPKLKIPVLSIFGDKDRLVSASYSKTGSALIPGCQVVEIGGASHFPFVDQAQIFCDSIRKFILKTSGEKHG